MIIKINKMQLMNFKGCKELTLIFGLQTDISGANATGKTRIFDAFTWLLFGKDSEDRKDFNIKCLDSSGEPIHRQDTAVTAELEIDGMKKTFSRMYCEKWQKKRGEESPEFTGHETVFYIDGVPMLAKEYQKAVDAIIPEETFKMLTNPFYFPSMKWSDRREILFKITKPLSDQEIAISMPEIRPLLDEMAGKPLDLFRREISSKKKLIKDSLLQIPPRIDELLRSIPKGIDYKLLEDELSVIEKEIPEVEKQIHSKTQRYEARHKENLEIQKKIDELRISLSRAQNDQSMAQLKQKQDIENKISLAKLGIKNQEQLISNAQRAIDHKTSQISSYQDTLADLRASWEETDKAALIFTEGYDCCPTCHQKLPAKDIASKQEQLRNFFNEEKGKKLLRIEAEGVSLQETIQMLEKEITGLDSQITDAGLAININKHTLSENEQINIPVSMEYPQEQQIRDLESQLSEAKPVDTKDLQLQKRDLMTKANSLRAQIQQEQQEEKAQLRISELRDQETGLSQQLADLERTEFMIERLDKTKVSLIEDEINKRFWMTRFKMFNQLINGGIEPCCEILIDGVPFPDANNAAKINAGIDIINSLASHFDCTAPIFVDNAEAVNRIIPTNSQLIRLVVTEDPQLIIKSQIS